MCMRNPIKLWYIADAVVNIHDVAVELLTCVNVACLTLKECSCKPSRP